MLLNCGVGEDSWESLGLQGNQSWIFIGRTDVEAETPILWPPDGKNCHWKRPCCWEKLKAGGEGDSIEWDCWMTSPTQWTWVWVHTGSLFWTGRPGLLQSFGLQRVDHYWVTELNWPGEIIFKCLIFLPFHPVHGLLKSRILKWFAIPFSSGQCFVRIIHHELPIFGGPMAWLIV